VSLGSLSSSEAVHPRVYIFNVLPLGKIEQDMHDTTGVWCSLLGIIGAILSIIRINHSIQILFKSSPGIKVASKLNDII
jgi:hypothetical protein